MERNYLQNSEDIYRGVHEKLVVYGQMSAKLAEVACKVLGVIYLLSLSHTKTLPLGR